MSDLNPPRANAARRHFLAASALASTSGLSLLARAAEADPGAAWSGALTAGPTQAAPGDASIRPFRIDVPQAALDDLKRRLAATRWPDRETVRDTS